MHIVNVRSINTCVSDSYCVCCVCAVASPLAVAYNNDNNNNKNSNSNSSSNNDNNNNNIHINIDINKSSLSKLQHATTQHEVMRHTQMQGKLSRDCTTRQVRREIII